MTFLEAAITVLTHANQPLSTAEITEHAIDKGMLPAKGKTSEASMSAALYKEAGAGECRVRKMAEPGATRPARGSDRWTLAEPRASEPS